MNNFITKIKENWLLLVIIILVTFLIFFRLGRIDMRTDDAMYSFRSIGYLDYVDSQLQTTPIMWFNNIPWWAKLSFHDAPPLVFLIQHLFFEFFGASVFTARLPFALAGVLSVILLYLLVTKLYHKKNIALLASFILAILSYHSWISRVGLLEGISLFFILLTLYLFLKAKARPKFFLLFGLSLGLALLTKYTVFFILPAIFVYLLLKNRKLLINPYFILSLFIAFLVFSPVLFYNFKIYQTRGHLDLQFSQLLHQDFSKDWPIISNAGIPKNYLKQSFQVWRELINQISRPLYLLIIGSILFIFADSFWHWQKKKNLFIILFLIFGTLQFALAGAEARYLPLLSPFLAMALAWTLFRVYYLFIKTKPAALFKKIVFFIFLIIIFGFEFFYNLNTNIFYQSIGELDKHYSDSRFESGGFNQLEDYLVKEADLDQIKMVSIESFDDLIYKESYLAGQSIFVYDPNLSYFSNLWYFRRWAVYYRQFFISAGDLAIILPGVNWFDYSKQVGVKYIYYIWGQNPLLLSGNVEPINQTNAEKLAEIFKAAGAEEKEIKNINGQSAFKIYKLKLNE